MFLWEFCCDRYQHLYDASHVFFGCCWFSISVACCCHEPLGDEGTSSRLWQGQQLLPYPTWLPDAEGDRGFWFWDYGWDGGLVVGVWLGRIFLCMFFVFWLKKG